MGLSENVGYIPNEIAIFHRDKDQQNHWVQWGTQHFQTHPYGDIGDRWTLIMISNGDSYWMVYGFMMIYGCYITL